MMRKMILGHCANGCNENCFEGCKQHYIDPVVHLCNGCIKKEEKEAASRARKLHSNNCNCYDCSQKKLREKRARKNKTRKKHAENLMRISIQEELDFE